MTEAEAERARKFRAWLGYTAEHEEALRYTNAPKGLAASALTPPQRQMLGALLPGRIRASYAGRIGAGGGGSAASGWP